MTRTETDKVLHHPSPIRLLLRLVEQHGLDPAVLLSHSGITQEMIEETHPLSWHAAVIIYGNAAALTEIPHLALEAGAHLGVKEVGPLGFAQYVAPTTREAIALSQAHQSVLQPFLDVEYTYGEKTLAISWTPALPLDRAERFIVELCMASGQKTAEDLVEPIQAVPLLVETTYPAPAYADKFREVFKTNNIDFKASVHRITYPSAGLDLPKFSHDPVVFNEMKNVIRSMVNRLSREPDIVEEVMTLLLSTPGDFPSVEQVAAILDVSVRTLRRKLVTAGTTFQAVLDKTRADLAKEYLQQSTFNIQQIAELCGFTEAHNFSLAFKRWTGMSPSHFRTTFTGQDDGDSS